MPDSPTFRHLKKWYFLQVHPAGDRKRHTLHVHNAGSGKGHTLHVHNAGSGKGHTLHVMLMFVERDTSCTSTAGCGKWYTLQVHIAGCGNEYTLHVHTWVRPRFRLGSEHWNWSKKFVSLGRKKKAWFRLFRIEAKQQKPEAKTNRK